MAPLSTIEKQRYDQVAAFLKRNGAPEHRVFSTDAVFYEHGRGFAKRPLRQLVFGKRGLEKFSNFQHFADQNDYMQALQDIEQAQDHDFDLALRHPNATLTQLEASFKFGNPFVDEEIFGYVREEPAALDKPTPLPSSFTAFTDITQVVGARIEHGGGNSYYCNPRWNPLASAGERVIDPLSGDEYALVIQHSPFGTQRWWKKLG